MFKKTKQNPFKEKNSIKLNNQFGTISSLSRKPDGTPLSLSTSFHTNLQRPLLRSIITFISKVLWSGCVDICNRMEDVYMKVFDNKLDCDFRFFKPGIRDTSLLLLLLLFPPLYLHFICERNWLWWLEDLFQVDHYL